MKDHKVSSLLTGFFTFIWTVYCQICDFQFIEKYGCAILGSQWNLRLYCKKGYIQLLSDKSFFVKNKLISWSVICQSAKISLNVLWAMLFASLLSSLIIKWVSLSQIRKLFIGSPGLCNKFILSAKDIGEIDWLSDKILIIDSLIDSSSSSTIILSDQLSIQTNDLGIIENWELRKS